MRPRALGQHVLLGASVIAAFLVSTPARSAPSKRAFVRHDLAVPGSVLSLSYGDVDADGWIDLVVSYRRKAGPSAERYLAIFRRRPTGLPSTPDLFIAAPSTAAAFDLGDVDGDGADELVYLMASGAFFQSVSTAPRSLAAGPVQRLVSVPTLVVVPEEEDLVGWDFLRPVGPGTPETLVLPGRRELRMFRRDEQGRWVSWCDVHLWQWSYYDAERGHYRPSGRGGSSGRPYAFRVTTVVPNIDFLDQTGDGRPDLIAHYEDRVALHPATAEGCFAVDAQYLRWFQVRTKAELESRDQRVSAEITDLDSDGIADLVLTKIGGGVRTLKTELRLFRGLRDGGFSDKPVQTFKDDGFATLARFIDIDGDGRIEMVHPHAPVSIMSMTRALLSSSIGLELRIRRPDPKSGFFQARPAQTIDVSVGLDLSSGAALRASAPVIGFDFNGDNRRDVVVPDGADAMVMLPGRPATKVAAEGWFDEDARIVLKAPGSHATQPLPVAANAPPEIIVTYPYRRDLSGRLVVFRATPR